MRGSAILAATAALGLAAAAPGLAATSVQQPAAEQRVTRDHDNLNTAVSTPAEDLNIKQTPIPEVLQRAVANPYDLRTLERCSAIGAEVTRLDAALGPDRDAPPARDTRTLSEKRGDTAGTVLKTGVEAVIPYRGVVRFVSGASAYEKKMQTAIGAGYERRGYLKGMGMKLNCAPPAAPAWFRPVLARSAPAPRRRCNSDRRESGIRADLELVGLGRGAVRRRSSPQGGVVQKPTHTPPRQ